MATPQTTTKKLPVAFCPQTGETQRGNFLVPDTSGGQVRFLGLRSGQHVEFGVVVYLGMAVSVADVLDRLVDSGQQISNPDATREMLERFLASVQTFPIGNILSIKPATNPPGFELVKLANTPSAFRMSGGSANP